MGLTEKQADHLHAGTWIWCIEADKFFGDGVVADLFGIDERLLKDGVSIETVREAVHPDDLQVLLESAQASIDDRRPCRSKFRVRRNGLVRDVIAIGQCFVEEGRIVKFVGTTIELSSYTAPNATLDHLIEQVIAVCDTARALGDSYRLQLLQMVLVDIATSPDVSIMAGTPSTLSH